MSNKTNYLEELSKLRETLGRFLKKDSKQLLPSYVPLQKRSHVVSKH
jgi:hypothetical protein